MIIFLISVIMFIVFYLPIYFNRKKGKDFFEPEIIISYIHILTIIPYMIYVSIDDSVVSYLVRNHSSFTTIESAILKFSLVQIISFIFLQIGMKHPIFITKGKLSIIATPNRRIVILKTVLITFAIGVISYIYIIFRFGGFSYIINNLDQRTQILAGNSYIMILTNFLPLSVYLYIYSFKFKKIDNKGYIIIILMTFINILLSGVFGGRKTPISFLIICFLIWHYSVNKIRIFSAKGLILAGLVSVFFITMPILRVPGIVEDFKSKDKLLAHEIVENIEILITQTSYVDHYLLVVNHFEPNNIWLGRSYIDLLKAPIPSKFYPNKPPVDDGVYLRTIAGGIDVIPSIPYKLLYQSSWPPESLGILYMNFWIPGIIVGMYILGNVYKKTYLFLVRSNYDIFSLLLYGTIITNFHLSNLRIAQSIITISFYLMFFSVIFGIVKRTNYINDK